MRNTVVRRGGLFMLGAVLTCAVVAFATQSPWYQTGQRITIDHNQGGPTTIDFDVGPVSLSGQVSVWFSFSNTRPVAALPVASCTLQYSLDANHDGIVQMNEWTNVGSASLTTIGLTTSGNSGVLFVPAGAVALRILVNDPYVDGYYSEDISWENVVTSRMYE